MVYARTPRGVRARVRATCALSRAARSRNAARFPQSWGRCCDVRPAPNLVGVRAHAQTPQNPSLDDGMVWWLWGEAELGVG